MHATTLADEGRVIHIKKPDPSLRLDDNCKKNKRHSGAAKNFFEESFLEQSLSGGELTWTARAGRLRPIDATKHAPSSANLGQIPDICISRDRSPGLLAWRTRSVASASSELCEYPAGETLLAFALLKFISGVPSATCYGAQTNSEIFPSPHPMAISDRWRHFVSTIEKWMVRYILVNTGGWLQPRKVLISPFAIGSVDARARGIRTDFTREEVKKSPKIEADPPGLRQEAMPDHSSKSSQVWGSVRFPQSVSTQDKGESQARSNRKKSSSNNLVRTLAISKGSLLPQATARSAI
jgi:hypothetical protein